jgi:sulfite exporter TauE/SafE
LLKLHRWALVHGILALAAFAIGSLDAIFNAGSIPAVLTARALGFVIRASKVLVNFVACYKVVNLVVNLVLYITSVSLKLVVVTFVN